MWFGGVLMRMKSPEDLRVPEHSSLVGAKVGCQRFDELAAECSRD